MRLHATCRAQPVAAALRCARRRATRVRVELRQAAGVREEFAIPPWSLEPYERTAAGARWHRSHAAADRGKTRSRLSALHLCAASLSRSSARSLLRMTAPQRVAIATSSPSSSLLHVPPMSRRLCSRRSAISTAAAAPTSSARAVSAESHAAAAARSPRLVDDIAVAGQFGELVDALERTQRTEAEQEGARIASWQQEDAELTEQIRAEAAGGGDARGLARGDQRADGRDRGRRAAGERSG